MFSQIPFPHLHMRKIIMTYQTVQGLNKVSNIKHLVKCLVNNRLSSDISSVLPNQLIFLLELLE